MPADDFELVYLTLADALELYAAIIGGTTTDATNVLRSQPALDELSGSLAPEELSELLRQRLVGA